MVNGIVFQGPIQPGTSEKKFRETGETVALFQGPVQPGVDVQVFRETGRTVRRRTSGGGGGGTQLGPTQADFEAIKRIRAAEKKEVQRMATERETARQATIER